jgi:predicted Zn-ribbon and HTH transcriptional regulator
MYRLIVIMEVGIIKRDIFKCERCGYEWFSHKYTAENPPIACAKCKSPYWNVKR